MIVAGVVLGWHRTDLPERPAEIDLVIGTNAARTGATPDPAPAPSSPAASVPPAPQGATSHEQVAQPVAPPPADGSPDDQLPAPPPPPPADVPKSQTLAAMAPPQPQRASARPAATPSEAPPAIRLGDGIAATYAEIENLGLIHPAQSEAGNVPPEYPVEAARRGQQGTVVLRIYIAASGDVSRVEIERSSGSSILDTAARDRIVTWHFHPATRDGRPVDSVEEQAIRFLP